VFAVSSAILPATLMWAAMFAGRLLCAALPERLPTGPVTAVLCAVSASALASQSLADGWVASFVLFGVTGFLLSGIWPLIVSLAVASHPQRSGSVAGAVIAAGSLGVAAAPVAVSGLLEARLDPLVFPLLAALIALAGGAVARPCPTRSPSTGDSL